MELRQFLEEIKTKTKHTKNKIVVGILDDRVIQFLRDKNAPVHTKEIYLNHKGLSHLARDSKRKRGAGLGKEDILKIPGILENPDVIAIEKKKNKIHLLYCLDNQECDNMIKIVIDTSFVYKGEKLTLVKTAGYVKKYNIFKNRDFEIVEIEEVGEPSPPHTSRRER